VRGNADKEIMKSKKRKIILLRFCGVFAAAAFWVVFLISCAGRETALGGRCGNVIGTEEGTASWYGKDFNGKPTASGEIYDMYALTAAHKTAKLRTYARVTNKSNNKSVEVKINDRGPFVGDRIIDLSYSAAEALDYVNIGTADVLIEFMGEEACVDGAAEPATENFQDHPTGTDAGRAIILGPAVMEGAPETDSGSAGESPEDEAGNVPENPNNSGRKVYAVQVGAFSTESGAEKLKEEISKNFFDVGVIEEGGKYKVVVGIYSKRSDAEWAAQKLREWGKQGMVRELP
jgi:rare lipoprotein A